MRMGVLVLRTLLVVAVLMLPGSQVASAQESASIKAMGGTPVPRSSEGNAGLDRTATAPPLGWLEQAIRRGVFNPPPSPVLSAEASSSDTCQATTPSSTTSPRRSMAWCLEAWVQVFVRSWGRSQPNGESADPNGEAEGTAGHGRASGLNPFRVSRGGRL